MQSIRFTVLVALIFAACPFASGQNYAFKVLANKGSNEIKSGTGWMPLKPGATLQSTDQIKIASNAYLGLVSQEGKPLEVKEAGDYTISALQALLSQTNNSVLVKYTDFILSSNSAESKKNRLIATGAVHRGAESEAIQLLLPSNQHAGVYNTTALISWETTAAGPYLVTLRNMFEDVLAKVETAENSFEINLSDPRFTNENAILIEVSSKSDPRMASSQHLIKKLPPADQATIKKSLLEILGDVNEPTALNKLVLAGFYEKNELYIDAIASYEQAIALAPDVPYFQEAYDEYLIRQRLKK